LESESESNTEQSEDDAKREKDACMQEDIEQDVNMVEPDAGPQLGSSVLINKPPVDGDCHGADLSHDHTPNYTT
jgi:hypothetical protein